MRWPAGAAEFSYRLGNDFPQTHPVTVRSMGAADKVKQDTGGRLEITVYPNNALGNDASIISQTRLGALEFVNVNQGALENIIPAVGLQAIPFAFSSHAEVWKAVDGAFGRFLRDTIVRANVGLYPLEKMWESGFRQISNYVRPVKAPADLQGLKIRTTGAPTMNDAFRALGAVPVSVNGSEIYTAMQTHLVDGGDITIVATQSGKYYEVQKFISLTNHQWQGNNMLASLAAMQKLPKAMRDVVERNFNAAALQVRDDIARSDQSVTADLESKGIAFNDTDLAAFRGTIKSAGLYAKWRDHFGAQSWAILERATGTLV